MLQCDALCLLAIQQGRKKADGSASALLPHCLLPPLVQLITAGLQSAQWGRKKAAAAALKKACAASPDALQPLAATLMEAVLKVGLGLCTWCS